MEKFTKLLKKLQNPEEPANYVADPYSEETMNADVASISSQLSPEDIEKIHYAETTGGKFLKNPESSASGHYQLVDSTRELAKKLAKEQNLDANDPNPLRKDANLMKALVQKYEKTLENAEKGPFEPNLENIYLMHRYGVQGGLNALNAPKTPVSKARFEDVKQLLAKKPKKKQKDTQPAQNLLELLKD